MSLTFVLSLLQVQEYHSKAFLTRIRSVLPLPFPLSAHPPLLELIFLPPSSFALRYVWLYIMVLITVGVYCANIYTAVTMLVADGWSNSIFGKCGDECAVKIPIDVGKWIFVGCIIFSFLLVSKSAISVAAG